MIKSLHLKNLVLVESCEINFESGFSVISGETGAGKTVFVHAISLALGERADATLIRQGEEKAFIEIAFDCENAPKVQAILNEAGIEFDQEDLLIIRREIVRNGKNRAFINSQLAPLPLLQKLGDALVDLVDQHAHTTLRSSESQRHLIDLFGKIDSDSYRQCYEIENQLKENLESLIAKLAEKEKETERLKIQWEDYQTLKLEPGEEEAVTEEHNRLAHFQQISEKMHQLHQGLSSIPIHRLCQTSESLTPFDSKLNEPNDVLKQAQIAIQEAISFYHGYLNKLENDPYRFQYLEERLAQIHRFKQKYGKTFDAALLQEKLNEFELLEQRIEEMKTTLQKAQKNTDEQCSLLTEKRTSSAGTLQTELTHTLKSLNMPECEVKIDITKTHRTKQGEDQIDLWLKANKGEAFCLVKESSSGGELSRMLLAAKTVLAEKNDTPTLIFDEIDANVGGETASLIGEKLKFLGTCRQVFSITHFPQVATQADHHIRVQKGEKEGRTVAELEILPKKEREKELLRMMGGKKFTKALTLLALFFSTQLFGSDFFFVHPQHPWHFYAGYSQVGKANFRHQDFKNSHVYFSEAEASLYYSTFLNEKNIVSVEVGDLYINFDWEDNPRFRQNIYNTLNTSIAFISMSWDRWRWVINPGVTVDAATLNYSKSAVYYGLLWGRYAYSSFTGLHIGVFGWGGIKNHYVLPVVGIDWTNGQNWRVNMIFPLDASIEYQINPQWTTLVAVDAFGGPYRFPRRIHKGNGDFKNGIFEVYSAGAEVAVDYRPNALVKTELGVGYNWGGWILIKDKNNHHGKYYHFNAAPYIQGNIAVTF